MAYTIPGALKLGLGRKELTQACYRWIASHPALNDFWALHGEDAVKRFVVRNAFGRRRVLTTTDEKARYREGINHPVQSFVSDLINTLVVETFCTCNDTSVDDQGRYSRRPKDNLQLSGQMHDSLLFSIKLACFDECVNKVLEIASRPRMIGGQQFEFPVSYYTKDFEDHMREAEVLRG